ncbi:MAG: 2-oxoglutarate dehydrogenase E1 component [Chthonomonadales bacterium]
MLPFCSFSRVLGEVAEHRCNVLARKSGAARLARNQAGPSMNDIELFYGPNAGYALELYEAFLRDPESVDAQSRATFEEWRSRGVTPPGASVPSPDCSSVAATEIDVTRIVSAARVTRLIRVLGHRAAHIDPLGSVPPGDNDLELATHGLNMQDLASLPANVVNGPLSIGAANALEAIGRLRRAYSGSVGYEDGHMQSDEERQWFRDAVESRRFFADFTSSQKRHVLELLTKVDTFEQFLDKTYVKVKRFSVEGVDMVVPICDNIIREAAASGTREVVMGMAHRGRLNVLANIFQKPYAWILKGFEEAAHGDKSKTPSKANRGYSGDVKYHLGFQHEFSEIPGRTMPISLAPNPSHLEFVNPVVMGRARAAQERRDVGKVPQRDVQASLCILIHGDAAFPGQGIVAETLNMGQLTGYGVGGTIHIILNNQIGFTTDPYEGRSTLYASDLAKGYEIPIVHVNADDAEACIAVARMAFAYRERFHKDFLIDLVGYRRYGHNEGDEPALTQPKMYEIIRTHPRVREVWAKQLESECVVTRDEAEAMVADVNTTLTNARKEAATGNGAQPHVIPKEGQLDSRELATGVSEKRLKALNEGLLHAPPDFTVNPKLATRELSRRREAFDTPNGVVWGHAEALAFASILEDGTAIRLSGQDSERGTFGHRNAVLHDPITGAKYCSLQAMPNSKASFDVFNSPLSEGGVLGFEYGYSMHATDTLVLWEAQFGDFVNSAQVIVDQFISSGNAKWQQTPSLTLLLPHGYEGQGPEHSSARLERFLQLCADDNMRVVNCTTAAQYFHLLRRQVALMHVKPRPLIVMTPKSLLRLPEAASDVSELVSGRFHPVIGDAAAQDRKEEITRAVFCTGKVYMDLVRSEAYAQNRAVAVIRVEELYPFPEREIEEALSAFINLNEVVWLQEEPQNMGAWTHMQTRMQRSFGSKIEMRYVGRAAAASPAVGSGIIHANEQARIISEALESAPAPTLKRSKAEYVR